MAGKGMQRYSQWRYLLLLAFNTVVLLNVSHVAPFDRIPVAVICIGALVTVVVVMAATAQLILTRTSQDGAASSAKIDMWSLLSGSLLWVLAVLVGVACVVMAGFGLVYALF